VVKYYHLFKITTQNYIFRRSKNLENLIRKIKYSPLWVRLTAALIIIAMLCTVFFFVGKRFGTVVEQKVTLLADTDPAWNKPDYITYEPIVKNEYSRPGTYLSEINGLVVHYVANPGTSAANNRSYFNGLAKSGATWASSHFIVGLEGEVLQLVPLDEIAYCSNERNKDTIGIECCHPDETGKFSDETYSSLITLLADLCKEYKLDPLTQIIRHYDVTGKMCPLYFVEHEDEWKGLLTDVAAAMTEKE